LIARKRTVLLWASRLALAIAAVHLALGIVGKLDPLAAMTAMLGWIAGTLFLATKT